MPIVSHFTLRRVIRSLVLLTCIASAGAVFMVAQKYWRRAQFLSCVLQHDGAIDRRFPRWVTRARLEARWPVWACRVDEIFVPGDLTCHELASLRFFPEVRSVHFWGNIDDAGLDCLRSLKNIEELNLLDAPVTDAGMWCVARLRTLKRLGLSGTLITDDGLRTLTALDGLTELSLLGTSVTDEGVCMLRGMNRMRYLDVSMTRISDRALECISELRELEELYVVETGVTDEGLVHLWNLDKLRQMSAGRTRVTNVGLRLLAERLDVYVSEDDQALLPSAE